MEQQQGAEDVPVIYLHEIKRQYLAGRGGADDPGQRQARAVGGTIGRAGRAVGLGQVDAAAHRGPARGARFRRGLCQRRADLATARHRAHPAAPHRYRLRLPVAPAAAGILGAGERDDAADDPRPEEVRERQARARRSSAISASATASPIGLRSCRAASSSVSRSRARSPMRRGCCSRTSRPAISIRTPPTTCSRP